MPSFAHILNPVNAPQGSELARVQPVTFASIRRALDEVNGEIDVRFFSAQFAEDHPVIPDWISRTPDLQRSMADLGTFRRKRKLPLFRDILERLDAASDADYFIYTNSDICLMPSFYRLCNQYAEKGYDAFAINRRRITNQWTSPAELELMYAEAGEKHPGYDTLVFRKSLLKRFVIGDICIGIPFFDTVLIHNFYAFAQDFRLFTGKHLTFHIGMELVKRWGDADEYAFNRKEYAKVRKALWPHFRIANFPGANLAFPVRHLKWFFNPTFHYPTMFRLDLSQLGQKRKPRRPREVTGLGNRYYEWLSRQINFDDEF